MFIKIMNKGIATRLKKAGFYCFLETQKTADDYLIFYCFEVTTEFEKEFKKHEKYLPPGTYVRDSKLRFGGKRE